MDARLKKAQDDLEASAQNLKRDELTLSEDEFKKSRQKLGERQNQVRALAANMQRQAK